METLPHTHGTAYIHVGTHKTGTTSIQAMLAMNDELFRAAGVFVPQTGRIAPGFAGHHNIAWGLAGDRKHDPCCGTLDGLFREIDDAHASTVCLSSEEFEAANLDEKGLVRLRDGLLEIGYCPQIIVYLRPQADYLESLYAEMCSGWDIDFQGFLDTIIAYGRFGFSMLDYHRLLERFAAVFGSSRLTVRRYRSGSHSAVLLRDFTALIAPTTLNFCSLVLPERLNPAAPFSEIVAARANRLNCTAHHRMTPQQKFDPLCLLDIVRIITRFAHSNANVERLYGARVGSVTVATFVRELANELLVDRESRYRKRLIRSLVESSFEAAA